MANIIIKLCSGNNNYTEYKPYSSYDSDRVNGKTVNYTSDYGIKLISFKKGDLTESEKQAIPDGCIVFVYE